MKDFVLRIPKFENQLLQGQTQMKTLKLQVV